MSPIPSRKMLSTQSPEDRRKYENEVATRLEAAHFALQGYLDRHPDVNPEILHTAIAPAVFEATLSGLNFVIEELRTATVVAIAEGRSRSLDPRPAASLESAAPLTGTTSLAPPNRGDFCTCCEPPVLLAQHSHKPIQGIYESPEEVAAREERAQEVVTYRDAKGRSRRLRLEDDQALDVTVRGRTWTVKETLRKAGLSWNGKQGAESAWSGRIGPEGLLMLGSVHDDQLEVRFPPEAIEGQSTLEQAAAPRAASPTGDRPKPGPDFY